MLLLAFLRLSLLLLALLFLSLLVLRAVRLLVLLALVLLVRAGRLGLAGVVLRPVGGRGRRFGGVNAARGRLLAMFRCARGFRRGRIGRGSGGL